MVVLQASSASSERSFSKAGLHCDGQAHGSEARERGSFELARVADGREWMVAAEASASMQEGREGREVVTLDSKVWITTGDHPRCPTVETVEYRRSEGAVP